MVKSSIRLIETFVEAVKRGSIAASGRSLGISSAAASKNIQTLENVLGVQLLNRTTRSISLTEIGSEYYESVRQVVERMESIESSITMTGKEPQGKLTLHSTYSFGKRIIAPSLPKFLQDYPKIRIDLTLSDRISDITSENVDLAIRTGEARDQTMIAKNIWDIRFRVIVSSKYLEKRGRPKVIDDLSNHNCLGFRFSNSKRLLKWPFKVKGKIVYFEPSGNIISENSEQLLDFCKHGMGILLLPDYIVNESIKKKEVVELFGQNTFISNQVFLYYSEKKREFTSLKLLRNFLIKEIQKHKP